jgi:hypothetical protein
MEYVIFSIFMVILSLVLFYGQIFIYLNKYKNLKGLRNALNVGAEAKAFYMTYMGIYQAGDKPHIRVNFKDIVFDKPIEFSGADVIDFNISPLAVKNLHCDAKQLSFSAKFSGEIITVKTPLKDIQIIAGKESGIGFVKHH